MSEWKEYKLSEISTIVDCEHKTASLVENSEYISVRTSNIKNGRIDFDNANRVSYETYLDWTKRMAPNEGDIILAREAPVCEVGYVPKNKKVCLGQRTVLIKPNIDYIDSKYLLYYLINGETKYDLISRSTGSVVEHLNVKDIKDYPLTIIESLLEQHSIASILSSLDDKIDLLHRQNKTLEALAETLFRQWFVEEAEEGWGTKILGDVCLKTASGGTPSTKVSDYYGGSINWYSTKELNDNFLFESVSKITEQGLENSSAKLFPENTVVIAIYAAPTVGRLGILGNEASFNQAACGFIPDETIVCFEYLYLHLLLSRQKLNDMASGSAQQNLNVGIIKSFPIPLPPKDKMDEFRYQVRPLFQKIKSNSIQIRTLTRLRDTLLPKLMNGEVRVN